MQLHATQYLNLHAQYLTNINSALDCCQKQNKHPTSHATKSGLILTESLVLQFNKFEKVTLQMFIINACTLCLIIRMWALHQFWQKRQLVSTKCTHHDVVKP